MNRFKLMLLLIIQLIFCVLNGNSQTKLDLDYALNLARFNSVEYHSAKTAFLSDYWDYKLSKIKLYPKINLSANPVTINRSLTERYDFENNIEVFRENKMLTSNSSLSLTQPISATGGNISVGSNISRISNLGDVNIVSYNTSPFRLSYSQPLFGAY